MAVSKKGSRNITVEGHKFRWRAIGNDDLITVLIWPESNDRSLLIGSFGYHQKITKKEGGGYALSEQLIVTNRLIRKIILHYGTDFLIANNGRMDVGALEKIVDISQAVRAK